MLYKRQQIKTVQGEVKMKERQRKRRKVLPIWFTDKEEERIRKYAERYGMTLSSFLRFAVFKFLEKEERVNGTA